MSETFEYLDLEDLLWLAAQLVGDPPAMRDLGLLESAAARPRASAFGHDVYTDVWSKAAALVLSIVKNHALVDGSKRLAWLATAVFLEINDVPAALADNDAVYELVVLAAASDMPVEAMAVRLRELVDQ